MPVIRAFIAIDLPTEIQQSLERISTQLQQQCTTTTIRWVPPKNIHLTLKFLGEVSSTNLEMLNKIVQAEAVHHRCFELSIGGLGAFPTLRRPRVIWVGVQAPNNLLALQRSIEAETVRLGYLAEDRPFSAHLTLARISHNATPEEVRKTGDALVTYKVGFLGTVHVERIRLFRSDLKPGGAIYTPLYSAPLMPAG
ncbi:MAG TPA: RNA 2',3'-cyclic phosphodiesterase [Anaerolineaceae bacterium]|jgi:2'-5' RNA ligase|nr:RNA 2',3'-cyclic phosphodiesterase [Anaerolineaceae bacterium]